MAHFCDKDPCLKDLPKEWLIDEMFLHFCTANNAKMLAQVHQLPDLASYRQILAHNSHDPSSSPFSQQVELLQASGHGQHMAIPFTGRATACQMDKES